MNRDWMNEELSGLAARGLRRHLRSLAGAQAPRVDMDGRELLNFCSNDYLGLAADPRLREAFSAAAAQYGMGAGASRLVCGGMVPHAALESSLAELKTVPAALLFNSGYAANSGAIPALCGRGDMIFSDRLNHASIVDGIILSRAEFKRYPHVDMQALEAGLKQSGGVRRRMIVTDTVFSMDGDRAPLGQIVDLARRYDAMVMIDEAHAFGLLGENGGGLSEETGLGRHIDVHMGTLSKAAGCVGAYICGDEALKEFLINHARSFIYSTALPPAMAAAAAMAVSIIRDPQDGGERRRRVSELADRCRTLLRGMGFDTMQSSTPIIPVRVGDPQEAVRMSGRLLEQGIFVQAIRPPTVPAGSARLRITVTAAHTPDDVDRLAACFKRL